MKPIKQNKPAVLLATAGLLLYYVMGMAAVPSPVSI